MRVSGPPHTAMSMFLNAIARLCKVVIKAFLQVIASSFPHVVIRVLQFSKLVIPECLLDLLLPTGHEIQFCHKAPPGH